MIKAVTQADKAPPCSVVHTHILRSPPPRPRDSLIHASKQKHPSKKSVCPHIWYGMVPLYTYHMVCGTYGMVCGTPPPCSPFVIHSFTRNTKAYYFILSCHAIHTPHHHTLLLALHFVTTGTIVLSSGTIRYGRV